MLNISNTIFQGALCQENMLCFPLCDKLKILIHIWMLAAGDLTILKIYLKMPEFKYDYPIHESRLPHKIQHFLIYASVARKWSIRLLVLGSEHCLESRGGMRIGEVLKLTPDDIIGEKLLLRAPKSGREQVVIFITQMYLGNVSDSEAMRWIEDLYA